MHMLFVFICNKHPVWTIIAKLQYMCKLHKGCIYISNLNIKIILLCTKYILGRYDACLITLHAMHMDGYVHACYWVEISDTMVCMMREPRGQVIKSMLGFLIFSSRSWSSSQRSSFTNSATYMQERKQKTNKRDTFHIKQNMSMQWTVNRDQYNFYTVYSCKQWNV